MTITLNGEPTDVPDDMTTAALVEHLGLPDRGVAIALDGAVVPSSTWDTTPIGDGAVVDVVTAMQGG